MKQKVLMSWSSGKDSAFALHRLMSSDEYEAQVRVSLHKLEK